jgi:hypothetical protein
MGMILHDWDMPTKKMLIAKAYDACRGRSVHHHRDADRRRPARERVRSDDVVNMLIEFGDAFDYSGADFAAGAAKPASRAARSCPCGPSSAAIAYK